MSTRRKLVKEKLFDWGFNLAVAGTIISTAGSYYNNVLLDHTMAMLIWRWSNIIFAVYFIGRCRRWWNSVLSDVVMTALYLWYFITNEIGLSTMP